VDITYLRSDEGWLYLAAVQDAYSRAIVGWSMATYMRATLVVDALKMALARRHPGPGLIHHSDQGSQDVSLAFGRAAREAGIAVSMGSRGDAYDNAVAETFVATIKKELVNRRSWPSRLELQSAVFDARQLRTIARTTTINDYNLVISISGKLMQNSLYAQGWQGLQRLCARRPARGPRPAQARGGR